MLGLETQRGTDRGPPEDIVYVNLVLQGTNLKAALYGVNRGGLSAALERPNDHLPRREVAAPPLPKELEEEFKKMNESMRQMILNSRTIPPVLTLEALGTLSDRSFRTVLVIANIEDASNGFIPLEDSDKQNKILSNKENLKHYADMGAAAIQRSPTDSALNPKEWEMHGSLQPSCIRAIIVPAKWEKYNNLLPWPQDKVFFAASTTETCFYRPRDGIPSEKVEIQCPNYLHTISLLLRSGQLGDNAKQLLVLHMMKF